MISIVVLAFSGIALTVFSDGVAVKPEHTPHIDLSDKVNIYTDTVQIVHSGGEAIDLDKIKVMLYVQSPNQPEFMQIFDMSDPQISKDPYPLIAGVYDSEGNLKDISTDGVFRLGDCIVIHTNSDKFKDNTIKLKVGNGIDLQNEDLVNMFIVDIPSQQVIQKAGLQGGSRELPYWISPYPYGSVYDSSAPSGWLPIELVGAIGDGLFTNSTVPGKSDSVYEEYEFGIDADEMGISNPLKLVKLKIIYGSHDKSSNSLKLEVSTDGLSWTQIAPKDGVQMEEYKDKDGKNTVFDECIAANVTYDLTDYVKNTDKLKKLKVKFSVSGNPKNEKKYVNVDFVGLHVES